MSLRVDHVIYAVRDLDAAAKALREEHGLASLPGGRHPGWGTANRIVPLGEETYLELIAVVDPQEAHASDLGRMVLAATADGDRLAGWAVATDDLEAVAARLGVEVADGSRLRPDGSTLRWRLAGMTRAMQASALPFFIQWDGPADLHPGAAPAGHGVAPRGIAEVAVQADPDELREWLGEADVRVVVSPGEPALVSVAIATEDGTVVLG